MRTLLKLVVSYIALSVAIGLMWGVLSYPDLPSTWEQWLWMFALALPLQVAGELAGALLWNNKATHLVERHTAGKSFSLLRIAYGFLLVLGAVGLLAGVSYGWQVIRPLTGL